MMIQTKKSDDGKVLTMVMPEKFDFQLHVEFRNVYETEKTMKTLVLDMSKTVYVDSSALGMMLQLKEHADSYKSKVSITNAKGNIMQIIEIAHFDKLFNVA